ncbi:MAG: hypothetical protein RL112_286 [Planctomycetota bacterium]
MQRAFLGIVAISLCAAPVAAQWSSNPAANTVLGAFHGDSAVPKLAACGDGSTWFGWFDNAGGGYVVRAQKLDAAGVALFPAGLVVSSQPQGTSLVDWDLVHDGAGGCVLAFTDIRAGGDLDTYAYRLDAAGNQLWGANGVALSTDIDYEANPTIARLVDGSFVVAWVDSPNPGPGAIRMQKLDAAGVPQFPANSVSLVGGGVEKPAFQRVVATDDGGWILSYVRDIASFSSPRHVRAQKYDAAGVAQWAAPVSVYDQNSVPIAHLPRLVADGNGAWICWHRSSGSYFDALVQRLDANGVEQFPHNGLAVSSEANMTKIDPSIDRLANGDLLVAFGKRNSAQSAWGLGAQRVTPSGALAFGATGLAILPLDNTFESFPRALAMGDTAVIACFQSPSGSTAASVLAWRFDAGGAPLWPAAPTTVSSAASGKDDLELALDRSGVVRMSWDDERTAGGDIVAQNLNADGTLGAAAFGFSTYCIAAPNSTGAGARIGWEGNAVYALNDFTLTCNGLPPNTTVLAYCGPNQAQTPFVNGYRCVAGATTRIGAPTPIGQSGAYSRRIDYTQAPLNGGVNAIAPGVTRHFQLWYRNAAGGGAGSNLSDGLRAVFAP